jgi:hypothetical protein
MGPTLKALAEFSRAMVRPSVTWGLVGVVAYLAFQGRIETETFLPLVALVTGYWFASRKNDGQG